MIQISLGIISWYTCGNGWVNYDQMNAKIRTCYICKNKVKLQQIERRVWRYWKLKGKPASTKVGKSIQRQRTRWLQKRQIKVSTCKHSMQKSVRISWRNKQSVNLMKMIDLAMIMDSICINYKYIANRRWHNKKFICLMREVLEKKK